MILRSQRNRACPAYFSPGLLLAVVLAAAACPPSQAQAREPVVVGGSGLPEVEVDLSAIDRAEPAYTQRRLLMPGAKTPPSGRIVLTPPERLNELKAAPKLTPPGAPGKTLLLPPKPAPAPPAPSGTAALPAAKPKSAAKPAAPGVAAVTPEPKPAAEPPPPRAKKRIPVDSKPLAAAPPPPPAPAAKPPEPAPAAKEPAAAPLPAEDIAAAAAAVAPAAGPGDGSRELAALVPPTAPIEPGRPLAIGFETDSAELDSAANAALTRVADALNENAELRLQIVAYATGSDANASQARRMSLSRALAVRSHLIDMGVRSTRMDVRALGNKFETGPGDRVDLVVVRP